MIDVNGTKGYLGTTDFKKRHILAVIALLKKLGLKEADYNYFVYLESASAMRVGTQILMDGKWVEMVGGDAA